MPKSTKHIKVTDRKKAWMKKVKPSEYIVESIDTKQTILIVAEGQTETLYFESFPVLTLTVETVNLEGQSKQKLIELTDQIIQTHDESFDQIWCVFDMDIKKGEVEFSHFDNAVNSGYSKEYNIAYSNDSFELWFYLHYQYTEQQNHRKFYYDYLSSKWNCNYEKEGKTYSECVKNYQRLLDDADASQENAIQRAKRLLDKFSHLEPHNQNPVTKVFELVEVLNENCRR